MFRFGGVAILGLGFRDCGFLDSGLGSSMSQYVTTKNRNENQ